MELTLRRGVGLPLLVPSQVADTTPAPWRACAGLATPSLLLLLLLALAFPLLLAGAAAGAAVSAATAGIGAAAAEACAACSTEDAAATAAPWLPFSVLVTGWPTLLSCCCCCCHQSIRRSTRAGLSPSLGSCRRSHSARRSATASLLTAVLVSLPPVDTKRENSEAASSTAAAAQRGRRWRQQRRRGAADGRQAAAGLQKRRHQAALFLHCPDGLLERAGRVQGAQHKLMPNCAPRQPAPAYRSSLHYQ